MEYGQCAMLRVCLVLMSTCFARLRAMGEENLMLIKDVAKAVLSVHGSTPQTVTHAIMYALSHMPLCMLCWQAMDAAAVQECLEKAATMEGVECGAAAVQLPAATGLPVAMDTVPDEIIERYAPAMGTVPESTQPLFRLQEKHRNAILAEHAERQVRDEMWRMRKVSGTCLIHGPQLWAKHATWCSTPLCQRSRP